MKLQIPHGHSTLVLFHFTNITAISKAHNHTHLKCMLTITRVVNYTASNIGSKSQESDCQKYHETRYEIHQIIMPNSKTKSTSNKWSSLEKQSFEIPHARGLNLEKCICADTQKDLTQLSTNLQILERQWFRRKKKALDLRSTNHFNPSIPVIIMIISCMKELGQRHEDGTFLVDGSSFKLCLPACCIWT